VVQIVERIGTLKNLHDLTELLAPAKS
jgi:hypothetical protein